jgi:riboflavin synthase
MFTGLVAAVGTVRRVAVRDGGRRLTITSAWRDLADGESIAVDGACLTVIAVDGSDFEVEVVATSLERTNFGDYAEGRRINLERALRAGDPLGGHLVQGHVDGVGTVVATRQRDDVLLMDLAVPAAVAEVSIPLGSITVDGVSLTVNALPAPRTVQVALIPFTLERTTLADRRPGDRLHLEGDLVGKYLKHLLAMRGGEAGDR